MPRLGAHGVGGGERGRQWPAVVRRLRLVAASASWRASRSRRRPQARNARRWSAASNIVRFPKAKRRGRAAAPGNGATSVDFIRGSLCHGRSIKSGHGRAIRAIARAKAAVIGIWFRAAAVRCKTLSTRQRRRPVLTRRSPGVISNRPNVKALDPRDAARQAAHFYTLPGENYPPPSLSWPSGTMSISWFWLAICSFCK